MWIAAGHLTAEHGKSLCAWLITVDHDGLLLPLGHHRQSLHQIESLQVTAGLAGQCRPNQVPAYSSATGRGHLGGTSAMREM